jgi:hypothetical protein
MKTKNLFVLLIIAIIFISGCVKEVEEEPIIIHDQNISGEIKQEQIWSGTIYVTGDIWMDEDITLTIMPGTTLLISAGKDDHGRGFEMIMDKSEKEKIGPIATEEYAKSHIEINGRIIAAGVPDERITFTSDSTNPSYADWSGIELRPGSRIEYCIIEYAGRAGLGVWSDVPNDESVLISNNIIRHIFMGAVGSGGTASPKIISNDISDCGSEGINVGSGGGRPYIAYNTIKDSTVGIATLSESFAIIENNVLIDNIQGITSRAEDTIRYNYISSLTKQIHEQSYMGYTFPYIVEPEIIRFSGIVIAENSFATIEFNDINNNDVGILVGPEGSPPQILKKNNIYNNKINIDNQIELDITASNNWWGTTNINEIDVKIWDYHDDLSLGKVSYIPISNGGVEEAGVVIKNEV